MDLLEFHKERGIVTASWGGLTPIVRHKGGPIDPVLTQVAARLGRDTGKQITQGQVLGLWLRAQNIVQVT